MDDTSENIKQFNLANNFFSPETSAKQSQQESVENESVAGIIDDTTEEATYDESNAGDESVRSKNENFGKTINETVELSDSGDNGDEDEEESESEESESVGDEEEEEEEEEEEDDDDDEENVVESKSGKPKVKSNAINETTESANEVSIQAKSEPSAIVIDSTDETATDKSEPFSKETSSSSEKDDSRSANEESKQLDESQGFDQANQTAESDIIQPKINRNKKKANRINDSDELPDIECSSSVVQNEKPNYRDEIENEEEASPPRVSSTEYRSAARDDSGPEIIELSDNDPSTPVRKPSQFQNPSNKAITGLLTLSKSAIKGDQRILSSWSPNYENYTPNTISRIKLERVKLKVKENQPIERKLKMLDIKDEVYQVQSQRALPDAASQMSNPSKLDKNDLRAQVAQGLNKQQTNRNYSYEEKLKSITDPMFESLEQKPDPEQNYDDFVNPKGLKVKLLPHQCYSMQWLKWREGEYPHGGILADDMGLGKTLTILGYLKLTKDIYERRQREKLQKLEDEEEEEEDQDEENDKENDIDDRKYLKRLKSKKNKLREEATSKRLKTLIVLPASLLHQWQGEINNKFEKNSFKVHVYHEANRKKYSYNLDDNDIVFTTYEIISREVNVPDKEGHIAKSDSPLVNIKWKRIILDEAHRIKNHSTKANKAMCLLKSKYRIAITGTPVHNSLNDLYSLVKFLHFEPLDDFGLWKYLFASETFSGRSQSKTISMEREKRLGFWLKFLSDYLILRRTKKDKFHGTDKCIVDLPEKKVEEVRFKLNSGENLIYQKIFKESKDKVNKFLNAQQNKLIGKANGIGGSNVSEIFVYLLRLRQACCHMSLLAECLDTNELKNAQFEQEGVEGLMDNLNLSDKSNISGDLDTIKDIQTGTNLIECLDKSYMSSKIGKSLNMIVNILDEYQDDKLIVVSQWTSVLGIIGRYLKKRNIEFCEIKGDVMLFKRNEIVEHFNSKENTSLRVMLLSLTAGGVGLNLIGANRMFLMDIHWNPALEQQCADRIYRVGQKKNVTIYKMLCEETIEERIQQIQKHKIEIAEKVCRSGEVDASLPGATGNAKLTIKDLKVLFQEF